MEGGRARREEGEECIQGPQRRRCRQQQQQQQLYIKKAGQRRKFVGPWVGCGKGPWTKCMHNPREAGVGCSRRGSTTSPTGLQHPQPSTIVQQAEGPERAMGLQSRREDPRNWPSPATRQQASPSPPVHTTAFHNTPVRAPGPMAACPSACLDAPCLCTRISTGRGPSMAPRSQSRQHTVHRNHEAVKVGDGGATVPDSRRPVPRPSRPILTSSVPSVKPNRRSQRSSVQ